MKANWLDSDDELVNQKAMPRSRLLAPTINCLFEFQGHLLTKAISRSVNQHGTKKGDSLSWGSSLWESASQRAPLVGSDPFSFFFFFLIRFLWRRQVCRIRYHWLARRLSVRLLQRKNLPVSRFKTKPNYSPFCSDRRHSNGVFAFKHCKYLTYVIFQIFEYISPK